MSDVTFLEREPHLNVHSSHLHEPDGQHKPNPQAGEPAPMTSEAFSYAVAVLVENPDTGKAEEGEELRSVQILPSEQPIRNGALIDPKHPHIAVDARFIPDDPTRVIETSNPYVVSILANGGGYRKIDPPKSSAQTRAKSAKGEADTGPQEA